MAVRESFAQQQRQRGMSDPSGVWTSFRLISCHCPEWLFRCVSVIVRRFRRSCGLPECRKRKGARTDGRDRDGREAREGGQRSSPAVPSFDLRTRLGTTTTNLKDKGKPHCTRAGTFGLHLLFYHPFYMTSKYLLFRATLCLVVHRYIAAKSPRL